jgi:hypothetical protein
MDFTGYNPELENRDEIASTATPMAFTMRDFQAPEELDPRPLCRHDDQSNMSSCGGHGNTNCGELLWAYQTGSISNDRQFSRLFSYLEAQRLDGLLGRDAGSTISSGLKVSKEIGYLEEKFLPYRTPYPTNARSVVTDEMRKQASGLEGFTVKSHAWLESYQEIFQYLASQSGAVYVGSIWNQSFYAQNKVLERVNLAAGGGHAYAFLGYSKRKDTKGRNYIWRLNSHSMDSWTEIAPSVIDAMCGHRWSSIVGISDLTTPGPRKMSWAKERPLG